MRSTLATLYFWGTRALFSRGLDWYVSYALSTNFSRARGTAFYFILYRVPTVLRVSLSQSTETPYQLKQVGRNPRSSLPSPCLTLGVAPTPKTIQPTAPPTHSSNLPTLSASVPWPPYHPLTRPYSPNPTSSRRDPLEILIRITAALPPRGPPRHHLCPREATSRGLNSTNAPPNSI